MDGNADIDLRQGEDFSVEVTGNEKAIEANDIKVEKAEKEGDNTIHVVAKDAPRNLPSIKLKIIVPDLRSVKVNGDGDLEIKGDDFFTGDLDIKINGDGDFEAPHVDCAKLNIIINGDGDVVAKKFNCEDVTIQMDGNGDITTPQQARDAFDRYGVDGIMIGRATFGHPWLFREIKHFLATGEELPPLCIQDRVALAKRQLELSLHYKGEPRGIYEMRRHLSCYFKGLPEFKETRMKMVTTLDPGELFGILDYICERYADTTPDS
jgi:hypothetical protein